MTSSLAVSGLFIYPVKSLAGISVSSAVVGVKGFQHDRRWMVVDSEGIFMTQRNYPRMALVGTRISQENIVLFAPGMPDLQLPAHPSEGKIRSVIVWNDPVMALEVVDGGMWLSEFLQVPCRLVFMPDDAVRQVDPIRSPLGTQVAFADAFPFLLISDESLADLNGRLETPLPMNRFRPNITVAGGEAFAEDTWKSIKIGDLWFDVVKSCARCAITTVNQNTGVKGVEPLRTLATFRQWDGRVWFGQNLVHRGEGEIRLGDAVEVSLR